MFTGTRPPNLNAVHPKHRKRFEMPASADAPLNLRKCPPLEVGDLVKVAEGAPMGGERAFVYETYPDFDDSGERGVSLITESGRDTGGWSREEQEQWLTFVRKTGISYQFENVIKVARDYEEGKFQHAFN